MGYIIMGLSAVIAGFMLLARSDTPGNLVRSEWFAMLVMAGGVALALIGMTVQVVQVHRGDRKRA